MRKHFINKLALENEIPHESFVFLGGTCNNSKWREKLIGNLEIPYFDPVVVDWNESCIEKEEKAKSKAKIQLYVITPKQKGFYSIAEFCIAACLKQDTVITFINDDDGEIFDKDQLKSIEAIKSLLSEHTEAKFFDTLDKTANYLNTKLSNII